MRLRLILLYVALSSTSALLNAQTGRVTGTVRSAKDSSVVASAAVSLRDRGAATARFSMLTKGDGTFALDVPPGQYDVVVRRIDFAPVMSRAQVDANKEVKIDFWLVPQRIEGVVPVIGIAGSDFFNLSEPNFFLFGFENFRNKTPIPQGTYAKQIKFRVALRYRVVSLGAREYDSGIHVAYRQNSFWHLWEESAPFYDNNYNPQALAYVDSRDYSDASFAPSYRLFVEHESNGRDGAASRSWNRYGFGLDFGDYRSHIAYGGVRLWRAFSVGAENPDLRDRAGRGEVTVNLQPFVNRGYPLGSAGVSARLRINGQPFIPNREFNVFIGSKVFGEHRLTEVLSRFNVSLMGQWFSGTAESLLSYSEYHSVFRFGLATVR